MSRVWRAFFLAVGIVGMVATVGILFFGIATFRPELLQPDLKKEFFIGGLVVGQSTVAEVMERLGPPEAEHRSAGTIIFGYATRGLLLRLDTATETLTWYEVTADQFATSKGIRVGDSLNTIRESYGLKGDLLPIGGALRLRYTYGQAYAMDFWLDEEHRVTKIVFFKA